MCYGDHSERLLGSYDLEQTLFLKKMCFHQIPQTYFKFDQNPTTMEMETFYKYPPQAGVPLKCVK